MNVAASVGGGFDGDESGERGVGTRVLSKMPLFEAEVEVVFMFMFMVKFLDGGFRCVRIETRGSMYVQRL